MAKQKSSTNMSNMLIQSAKYMYGTMNQPIDTSEATKSFSDSARNYRKEKEAKLAEQEQIAATYLESMQTMDMSIVPEQYSEKVENSLRYLRDEYYKTTMLLKELKPTDRQYLEQNSRLKQLNTSIQKISSVFSDLNANKEEDLKTLSNKNYSKGNDLGKVSFIRSVLTGDAEIEITESGEVFFKNQDQWVSYNKIPDLTPYASTQFSNILTKADALSKSKTNLSQSDKLILRSQLENMITEGGKDIAISLASDDFVIPGGMGVVDAEAEYNLNPDAFIDKVVDSYMGFYEKTAQQGYQKYMNQLYFEQSIKNKGKGGGKPTEKEKMANYINTEQGWNNMKQSGFKSGEMYYEWDEESGAFQEFKYMYVGVAEDKEGNMYVPEDSRKAKEKRMMPIPTGRMAASPTEFTTMIGLIQPEGVGSEGGLP